MIENEYKITLNGEEINYEKSSLSFRNIAIKTERKIRSTVVITVPSYYINGNDVTFDRASILYIAEQIKNDIDDKFIIDEVPDRVVV